MRVGAGCVPEISHAILPCVLQTWKSERWNFAVFEVVLCVVVGELHAELMGLPGLRCCVPGLRGMAARELHAELVRVARPALRVLCVGVPPRLVRRERRGYSACPAYSAAAARAAFLARACASTSSRVRGPCVVPLLPSVRSHEMARLSRAPKRAR